MSGRGPGGGRPLTPLTRSRLQAVLSAHGVAPRRRHGQHFLVDDNLLAALVRESRVGPADRVLEVGPGPGLLTRHLLATGAEVVAIEIDPGMAAVAAELVEPELRARLRWIEGDVLAGQRSLSPDVVPELARCSAMVSNLPYAVAAPVLALLTGHPDCPGRVFVTVQREMGRRLAAKPASREYGSLSVWMTLCSEIEVRRRIGPAAFWPVPKVESVWLAIRRRSERPDVEELARLGPFLAAAFHNRRKTLVNSVAEAYDLPSSRVAEALGLLENEEGRRAEAWPALELRRLSQRWTESALGERHRPEGRRRRPTKAPRRPT